MVEVKVYMPNNLMFLDLCQGILSIIDEEIYAISLIHFPIASRFQSTPDLVNRENPVVVSM